MRIVSILRKINDHVSFATIHFKFNTHCSFDHCICTMLGTWEADSHYVHGAKQVFNDFLEIQSR